MHCSAVQCSAVQCSAWQCSAVHGSAVQCSAVQCSAAHGSAVQCSAVQCMAVHGSATYRTYVLYMLHETPTPAGGVVSFESDSSRRYKNHSAQVGWDTASVTRLKLPSNLRVLLCGYTCAGTAQLNVSHDAPRPTTTQHIRKLWAPGRLRQAGQSMRTAPLHSASGAQCEDDLPW